MEISQVMRVADFLQVQGAQLHAYCEGVLRRGANKVDGDVIRNLHSELTTMDAEHLVYAVEIGMQAAPNLFVRDVVCLLEHADAAVCCAAFRALSGLPEAMWSAELTAALKAVRTVAVHADLPGLGERVEVGTNQTFVSKLISSRGTPD